MAEESFDVAVVGAGQGGVYDAYRLALEGLSVVGIDAGSTFGGVWYHNRYPGARVDSDSLDYCYQFSRDLYTKWHWPERYADAPTLFQYHNFMADELNVRRLFRFGTSLCQSRWSTADNRWHLQTDRGDQIACRFLVMCTGVLSSPKPLSFPGLDRFKGDWVQTSRWPDGGVDFKDLRVGIIGTGSSGVQAIPMLAKEAKHLYVFQRHPHWAVAAQNRPAEPGEQEAVGQELQPDRGQFFQGAPPDMRRLRPTSEPPRASNEHTVEEQRDLLERQWEFGGHGMSTVFSDERTDPAANAVVADFVRQKVRQRVRNQSVAEKLCPRYPIGTRRLILEIDYYETYNQDNVTLVDILESPMQEMTERGVRTVAGEYDLDLLVFAIGFQSFLGPLEGGGIRNESGTTPKDVWARGPRTLFGLMTPGFPNMFHPTNAGSPSVLGNAMIQHEFFGNWIADCIGHMDRSGYATVEASDAAADGWSQLVDDFAQRLLPLRRRENQYMVHINEDGSRRFMPFCAGMAQYLPHINAATSRNYEGFQFSTS